MSSSQTSALGPDASPTSGSISSFAGFDYSDKSSLRVVTWAINGVCMALILIFVSLRFYSRLRILNKLEVDDVLILVAAIGSCAFSGLLIAATKTGLGTHVWNLGLFGIITTINNFLKFEIANGVLASIALCLTKMSIILTYYRIFPVKWVYRYLHVLTFITISTGVASACGVLFQCRPVSAAWNISSRGQNCINLYTLLSAVYAIGIATDLAIYALPLFMIRRLTMTRSKKILLSLLFSVGGFVCIASVWRIVVLYRANRIDVTYTVVPLSLLSVVELDLAICCASAPAIKPLFIKYWSRRHSWSSTNRVPKQLSNTTHSVPTGSLTLQELPYHDLELHIKDQNENRDSTLSQLEPAYLKGGRQTPRSDISSPANTYGL